MEGEAGLGPMSPLRPLPPPPPEVSIRGGKVASRELTTEQKESLQTQLDKETATINGTDRVAKNNSPPNGKPIAQAPRSVQNTAQHVDLERVKLVTGQVTMQVPVTAGEREQLAGLRSKFVESKRALEEKQKTPEPRTLEDAKELQMLENEHQNNKVNWAMKTIQIAQRQLLALGHDNTLSKEYLEIIKYLHTTTKTLMKDLDIGLAAARKLSQPQTSNAAPEKLTGRARIPPPPPSSAAPQAAPTGRARIPPPPPSSAAPQAAQTGRARIPPPPPQTAPTGRDRIPPPPPKTAPTGRDRIPPPPPSPAAPQAAPTGRARVPPPPPQTAPTGRERVPPPPPSPAAPQNAASVANRGTPPPIPPRPRSFHSTSDKATSTATHALQRARTESAPPPLEPPPGLTVPPLLKPLPNLSLKNPPPPRELKQPTKPEQTETSASTEEVRGPLSTGPLYRTKMALVEFYSSEKSFNDELHEAAFIIPKLNNPKLSAAYTTIMQFSDGLCAKLQDLANKLNDKNLTKEEYESAAKEYATALNSLSFDEKVQQAFSDYSANYTEVLTSLQQDQALSKTVNEAIAEQQTSNPNALRKGLASALILPVQRSMRYPLLGESITELAGKANDETLKNAATAFTQAGKQLAARVNAAMKAPSTPASSPAALETKEEIDTINNGLADVNKTLNKHSATGWFRQLKNRRK